MSKESVSLAVEIKKNGIPSFWVNTADMQEAYSLEVKGWTKKVHWKESTVSGAGLGVFASELIPKGTSYRILKDEQNLIVFKGPEDIPPLTEATKSVIGNYILQIDGLCFIMVPGSTVNHNSKGANTKVEKISNIEVHGIATIDIGVGEDIHTNIR